MTTFDQTQPVPEILHQIWMQGEPDPQSHPGMMLENARAKALAAGWHHVLWAYANGCLTSSDGIVFMVDMQVRRLLEACVSLANQTDIVRVVVLDSFGGLYLDLDVEVKALPLGLHGAWITGAQAAFSCDNYGMAGPAGHPFFRRQIALMLERAAQIAPLKYCGPGIALQVMMQAWNKENAYITQTWSQSAWEFPNSIYGHHLRTFMKWGSRDHPGVK
jgi:mannosyltransferase OCH1-like enzyme